jgi:hypothetical protein
MIGANNFLIELARDFFAQDRASVAANVKKTLVLKCLVEHNKDLSAGDLKDLIIARLFEPISTHQIKPLLAPNVLILLLQDIWVKVVGGG